MKTKKYPKHIAIIMDVNGRWAERKGLPRAEGHERGEVVFRNICNAAASRGIDILTVFAFSTENWKRPKSEVNKIMSVLTKYFQSYASFAVGDNYKISVIGNRDALSSELKHAIKQTEESTSRNSKLHIQIAINYGGRDEIIRAVNRHLSNDDSSRKILEEDIDANLDTSQMPNPDLIIRTGGEKRLSNFMLWQISYAELYFSDVLWPDFDESEFDKALEYYDSRNRKFGEI